MQFSTVLPTSKDAFTVFNMTEEQITAYEKELRPKASSGAGFLSASESLKDVCIRDLTFLKEKDISCDKLADTLSAIVELKDRLKDRFDLTSFATNGYQECPFGTCHKGRKDFTLVNLKTKETLTFTDLGIELIRQHAFFQGDTPYRIDPEKAIRVLEIKSGPYERITQETLRWKRPVEERQEAEEYAKKHAKRVFEDDTVRAYYTCYEDFENHKYNGLTLAEKLKSLGKTDLEIEEEFDFFQSCIEGYNPNEKITSEEGDFVHIIKKKRKIEKVDQARVESQVDFDDDAIFVYERVKKTWADIQ